MTTIQRRIAQFTLALFAPAVFATSGRAAALDREIELSETKYVVNTDNTAEITIHQRQWALTGQGRTAVSRIQVPYSPAFADAEIRYFRTIKDGAVVEGNPATVVETTPSADPLAPNFTDLRLKTVLAPNLDTGDAVEYEVHLHIRQWPKPDDFWFVHDLISDAPVLSEVVELDVPANRKVLLRESNAVPGKTEIVNGRRIERWETSNAEPASARLDPAEPLFAVSSIQSWDELGSWIRSLNRDASQPTPDITALAQKLTANKSTDAERIAAIYAYVATKIRYVGISFGIGRLQPLCCAKIQSERPKGHTSSFKIGSC
jgi:hypothetical protein